MFFNGFENEVICRFASMELVRGEWRRYLNNLSNNEDQLDDNNTIFDISVINIEENGFRAYKLCITRRS